MSAPKTFSNKEVFEFFLFIESLGYKTFRRKRSPGRIRILIRGRYQEFTRKQFIIYFKEYLKQKRKKCLD